MPAIDCTNLVDTPSACRDQLSTLILPYTHAEYPVRILHARTNPYTSSKVRAGSPPPYLSLGWAPLTTALASLLEHAPSRRTKPFASSLTKRRSPCRMWPRQGRTGAPAPVQASPMIQRPSHSPAPGRPPAIPPTYSPIWPGPPVPPRCPPRLPAGGAAVRESGVQVNASCGHISLTPCVVLIRVQAYMLGS